MPEFEAPIFFHRSQSGLTLCSRYVLVNPLWSNGAIDGGMITTMAHQRTLPATPDLFSTELARNGASPQVSTSKEAPYAVSQRHVLPQDLPNAVKHLTDAELDLLIATAVDEAKRRGRLTPKVEPNAGDEPIGAETSPKACNSCSRATD